MENKKDDSSKILDFREAEWDIADIIRPEFPKDKTLPYKVCISALALLLKQMNDKADMMDYVKNKIDNETTLLFLEKLLKEHYKYIEELSQELDAETLKLVTLYSEPNQFTEANTNSTPKSISSLAIEILELQKNDIVLDLGSGVNSFLIQAVESTEAVKAYGVEINTENLIVANIRSLIAGVSIEVIQGNVVSQNFKNLSANKVFSNHPLGVRLKSLQTYIDKNSAVKKYFKESKRTVSGDWVYNISAYLNMQEPGKTVAIMTNAGTWNKPDEELRKMLIEKGLVEGVILLPERLLSKTMISVTMLVLSQNDTNVVKMVDASKIFTEGRRQNTLESNDIEKIVKAYKSDTEISRKVSIAEISKQEYILNPQRYIGLDLGIKDGIKLGDVVSSINRGAMIKSAELDELSSIEETNYQYLMLKNIQNGLIDTELPYLKQIDEKYKKYCIKNNNLIISKLAPFKISMAHVKDDEEILATGNLYFIELDETKINPVFVEVFLQSELGIAQLNRYAKGATMKSISIQDLKRILLPNLSHKQQDKIAKEYENLCEQLEILQRQSEIVEDKKSRLFEEVL